MGKNEKNGKCLTKGSVIKYVTVFFIALFCGMFCMVVLQGSFADASKHRIEMVNPVTDDDNVAFYGKTNPGTEKIRLAYKVIGGHGVRAVYKSSNKRVATVNQKGIVSVKKAGRTTIKITIKLDNGKSFTNKFVLKVVNAKLNVTAPTKKDSYTFFKTTDGKESFQIDHTLNMPEKAAAYKVTNSVLSVDENGGVTVNKTGNCKVTVKATPVNGKAVSKVLKVKVTDARVSITAPTKTEKYTAFTNSGGFDVKYGVKDTAKKSIKSVTYRSSNVSVAAVSGNGRVTVKGEGSTEISVKVLYKNGAEAVDSFVLTVEKASVEVPDVDTGKPYLVITAPAEKMFSYGKTSSADEEFAIGYEYGNITLKELGFTSSDKNVATVNKDGKVTVKGEGSTVITVTAKDGTGASLSEGFTLSVYKDYTDDDTPVDVDQSTCKHIFFLIDETSTVEIPEHSLIKTYETDEIVEADVCRTCMTAFLSLDFSTMKNEVFAAACLNDRISKYGSEEAYLDAVSVLLKLAEENGGYAESTDHKKWKLTTGHFINKREDGVCNDPVNDTSVDFKTGRIVTKQKTIPVPAHTHTLQYSQCPKCGKKEVSKTICEEWYCGFRD